MGGFIILSLQEHRNTLSDRQKGTYRILCLGESTTQNQWPPFLEEILNQKNIGIRFRVIDEGKIATTTPAILCQVEPYLDKYHLDMVVAMIGVNDGGSHIPYEKFPSCKVALFIRSLRIYKLVRLLWLHMISKAHQLRMSISALEETSAEHKDNIKAEEVYQKAIELNPRNDKAYVELGWLYRRQNQPRQAEKYFKKAIELNPNNSQAYLGLGWVYRWQNHHQLAEECFKEAIKLNPGDAKAYLELGWVYYRQRQFQQAEECFRKGLEFNLLPYKSRLYGALAAMYGETGQPALAQEYYRKANELRTSIYNPMTTDSYHRLKGILDKRKIRLVCVQYPMRSVETLKRIFEGQEGIIFVDNEQVFKDAVRKQGYKEYFHDMFGGDFGHCTSKGNRLLAENIASVILKEVFGE